MIRRLIVPLSICAVALSAVLQGVMMVDDRQTAPGAALIIAGLATIVGAVVLHRRGKI